jgi:hypothetical protein
VITASVTFSPRKSSAAVLQNHRRNFRRAVLFPLGQNGNMVALAHHFVGDHFHFLIHFIVAASHEPLDGINSVLGIGDRLPLGNLANQPLTGLRNGHNRWRSSCALLVGDYDRLASLHHRYRRVGGAEINTYYFAHGINS